MWAKKNLTALFIVSMVALVAVSLGCTGEGYARPNTVKLTGTLSDAGEPLFVEGIENATGMIVIGFHPIFEDRPAEEITSASVGLDGTFELVDGIEPGEYLVTVRQWEPYPEKDLLKGKFSAKKSPIRKTIDADSTLDIDISKPEG